VSRAEKTKQYVLERVHRFERLERLRQSRKEFFEAADRFWQETGVRLGRSAIVGDRDLRRLDQLFTEIDSCKTKGSENEVYWNRVGPLFSKVILTLDELAGGLDEVSIPPALQVRDFLTDRSFVGPVVGAIIGTLIVGLVTYLVSVAF
jgi:hypothetical protein